ncbi:MAG: hypothetical protein JSR51_11085 [Proteobacteria bacterium]|nr:hypothetical protein [Pseudomonadota bacterium]
MTVSNELIGRLLADYLLPFDMVGFLARYNYDFARPSIQSKSSTLTCRNNLITKLK